jgi:hypothetical protein
MKRVFLWSREGGTPASRDLRQPVWLIRDPLGRVVASDVQYDGCVQVRPVADAATWVVALLLAPDDVAGSAARNGLLLPAGVHSLRHADLIEIDGQPFWVSVQFVAEESVYDVDVHPADAFCFFTRVRLSPGDPIVICPGTPETSCGMIYRKSAWLAAQESSAGFACAHCGFAPGRGEWTPPAPRSTRSLSHLLHLVAKESRQRDIEHQFSP